MAFDGSGNFVRLFNWVTDKTNSVNITASRMDGEDNGFAAGLTLAVTRDGQGKMAADFLPSTSASFNLGSVAFPWKAINVSGGVSGFVATPGQLALNISLGPVEVTNIGLPCYVLNSAGSNNGLIQNDAANLWSLAYGTSALVLGTPALQWDNLGNLFGRGVAQCKVKAATTSRNSTVTLANDPDLTGFALAASATYRVDLYLPLQCATTTTQGFKFGLGYTGTSVSSPLGSTGIVNGAANTVALVGTGLAFANVSTSALQDFLLVSGVFATTTAGTLSLQWSQTNSSANNTNLLAGAYMTVTRLL